MLLLLLTIAYFTIFNWFMLLVIYQHLNYKEQPPLWVKVLNVVLIGGGLAVFLYLLFKGVPLGIN
jgi:uncharacterized protein (DUF486 family)